MLNDCIEYFKPIESEDRMELLYRAADLFGQYGFSGPDVDTSLALENTRAEGATSNLAWDRCWVIINNALDMLLVGMGLSLSYSTLLHKLELLGALKIIENTDMHTYIVDVCSNDVLSVQEQFEALITFAISYYPLWLDTELSAIPDTFIGRVLAIHRDGNDNVDMAATQVDYRTGIKRIRKFYAYCVEVNTQLRLHELIQAGLKPGLPADFLLRQNLEYLTELEPEAPDHAAMELIGLLLLTDIDFTNIIATAAKYAEDFFSDTTFLSKVSSEISRIVAESDIQGETIDSNATNEVIYG